MKMTLDEAKETCHRWFRYLDSQREKSIKIQQLASQVRRGEITREESQRKLRMIDGAPTVYDGANLEVALKIILQELDKKTRT